MAPPLPSNDPAQAGRPARRLRLFGPYSRYAIAPVHTRFGALEWFVWDAHKADPLTGLPGVVRQAATEEEALRGLDLTDPDDDLDWENI
jgi:hypothetical protein